MKNNKKILNLMENLPQEIIDKIFLELNDFEVALNSGKCS